MYSPKPSNSSNLVEVDFSFNPSHQPPQNMDAEEAILGGVLLDPNALSRVTGILCAEAFYVSAHQVIYKAALALHAQGKPVDLMCVTTWMYDNKLLEQVGGQARLVQLVERAVSTVNIDQYALLVMDKYRRRQLIQAGNEIVELGYETATELPILLNGAEQKIFDVTQDKESVEIEQPSDIMLRVYENASSPKVKGLPSGIYDLDALIGGFKPKKLYVVAGRSGMGKSHFATALAAQALREHHSVVFFSAEMDRDELMTRILAWESGLNAKKIEEGQIVSQEDLTRLAEAINSLSGVPLYLDDTPGSSLTPVRIRSGIRRATAIYGTPKLVILDYLQLLGDESYKSNRVSELDKIANGCKSISKEFNVPFVALAQINRAVESRNDKRPLISDLRESGAIEQAADVILMLYRDEYYSGDNSADKGICEVIVGKQRGGATGTIKTLFQPETSRFNNIAQSREERLSHDNHVTNTNEQLQQIQDDQIEEWF